MVLFCFGALVALGLFLHQFVVCSAVEWYLRSQLNLQGKVTFSYQNSSFKEGCFSLHHLAITCLEPEGALAVKAEIEALDIAFDKDSKKFNWIVKRPHVTLCAVQPSLNRSNYLEKMWRPLPFRVEEGVLFLGTKENQAAFFSCDWRGDQGRLSVQMEGPLPSELICTCLHTSRRVMCTLRNFDLAQAFQGMALLQQAEEKEWYVDRGKVNGKLTARCVENKGIVEVAGNVKVSDLVCHLPQWGVTCAAQEVTWSKEKGARVDGEKGPFWTKWSPFLTGEGRLTEVDVTLFDGNDAVTPRLRGRIDRGLFQLHSVMRPCLEVEATLFSEQTTTPVRLIAKSGAEGDKEWKVEVDLHEKRYCYDAMGLYIGVNRFEGERYRIDLDCRSVSAAYLRVVHKQLYKQFPQLAWGYLDRGTVDVTLTGWVNEGKLARFEVRHLFANACSFRCPSWGATVAIGRCTGEGVFDLTKKNFLEGASWQLEVKRGQVDLEGGQTLQDVAAELAMHHHYVKPSSMTASIGEVQASLDLEGLVKHLNLAVGVQFSPKDLATALSSSRPLPETFFQQIELRSHARLHLMHRELALEGVCRLLRPHGPTDEIEFGVELTPSLWQRSRPMSEQLKDIVSCGWFHAKKLSCQTANIPLWLFKRKWYGKGEIGVQGKWTRKKIDLVVDPASVTYCSAYATACYPEHAQEKALLCHFTYDIQSDRWAGEIPLREVKLSDRHSRLVFNQVVGDLTLKEGWLFSDQMSGCSQGVHFSGGVRLDTHADDYATLFLTLNTFEGTVSNARAVLKGLDVDSEVLKGLKGQISHGASGMQLTAQLGDDNALIDWEFALRVEEGQGELLGGVQVDSLEGEVVYSKEQGKLTAKIDNGKVRLVKEEQRLDYSLRLPVFCVDFNGNEGAFDVRLEAACYDLCRLKGEFSWGEEGIDIAIDPKWSHSFGSRGQVSMLRFDLDGNLAQLAMTATFSALDCYYHLHLLSCAGAIPIQPSALEALRSPAFEGVLELSCYYDRQEEDLSFAAHAKSFTLGRLALGPFDILGQREGNCFELKQCHIGHASVQATMQREKTAWLIPAVDVQWKGQEFLSMRGGMWNPTLKRLDLPVRVMELNLPLLARLFSFDPGEFVNLVAPSLVAAGTVEIDLAKGLRQAKIECQVDLHSKEDKGDEKRLCVRSEQPLHLTWEGQVGAQLRAGALQIFHPTEEAVWTKIAVGSLMFTPKTGQWKGDNMHLVIPPEMVLFLMDRDWIPSLPFVWNNQLDALLTFTQGEKLEVSGRFVEGYYWIGKQLWECKDCFFSYLNEKAALRFQTSYQGISAEIGLDASFSPQLTALLKVWEICADGPLPDPLCMEISCNKQEGVFIQKVKGKLCGLDISLHHNPKELFSDHIGLKGQVKVDVPTFSRLLPPPLSEKLDRFGVGAGYELSGDFSIAKKGRQQSYFSGYLKGKEFELLGSELETLLSKVVVHPHYIEFSDLSLSDEAGIFTARHIRFDKQPNGKWHFSIPHLGIQDFRPSRLKQIGAYRGRIKPLTIRSLSGYHLRGIASEPQTWQGQGSLYFINTFKRHYHLLDIPFEIIGRLGLDMGLLIPVRGQLSYRIGDGKLAFTELVNSYSDGKLSQFFLSPTRLSYIDFEGNLNFHVRMKQYVLLKFTEPFTLSITGTVKAPRYQLN